MHSGPLPAVTVRGALAALLLVGVACSSALKVQRAPGLSKKPYHRVVVAAGIDELPLRKITEEAFATERLAQADVVPSVTLLTAGRGYEPDELNRELARAGADAVAIVALTEAGNTAIEMQPLGVQGSCVNRTGPQCRRPLPMTTNKGEPKPFATFRVDVYDMATAQLMWTAQVRTPGRTGETAPVLLRRLAHDVVQAWQQDGVLTRPPR